MGCTLSAARPLTPSRPAPPSPQPSHGVARRLPGAVVRRGRAGGGAGGASGRRAPRASPAPLPPFPSGRRSQRPPARAPQPPPALGGKESRVAGRGLRGVLVSAISGGERPPCLSLCLGSCHELNRQASTEQGPNSPQMWSVCSNPLGAGNQSR